MKKYFLSFYEQLSISNSDVKIKDIDKICSKVLCLIERTNTVLVVSLYIAIKEKLKIST